MPTGYFKVIYRPASNSEPAHAIGFMLPHTFENLNMVADFYSNLTIEQAFWVFVSRIDLIEETSGITFPGIPEAMKSIWGNDWFLVMTLAERYEPAPAAEALPREYWKIPLNKNG